MKQIKKIVGICLAMSLSTATSSVFGMEQNPETPTAQQGWVKKVCESRAGSGLFKTVRVGLYLYVMHAVWVEASAYCAGDVNVVSEYAVCPVVNVLDWAYAAITCADVAIMDFFRPYLKPLFDSAVAYIRGEDCEPWRLDCDFVCEPTNITDETKCYYGYDCEFECVQIP